MANGIFLLVPRTAIPERIWYWWGEASVQDFLASALFGHVRVIYSVLSGETDGWCVLLNHPMLPEYPKETGWMVERFTLEEVREKFPWLFKDMLLYRRF